jgi:pimeloyl-ACP methyl ester carboxylesterase
MPKDDLVPILTAGTNYDRWEDCGNIMKEPHEGFYRKVLSEFGGPVLFIHGSKDFRTKEKEFLASTKKGELKVVEGADHFGMIHSGFQPKFTDHIKEFVERVLPVE